MKAELVFKNMQFIKPGKTSRGVLYTKPSWFILLSHNGNSGIGECSVIPDLNPEYDPDQPQVYVQFLQSWVDKINQEGGIGDDLSSMDAFPSVRFGMENALKGLENKNPGVLYPSDFTQGMKGIPINGLIWMGDQHEIYQQIKSKTDQGFRCLKLKVGALDLETELEVLSNIRKDFDPSVLEIRIDANGAFDPNQALGILSRFAKYHIHSVEQPVKPGQWQTMHNLSENAEIPVALDEELIGVVDVNQKGKMLRSIKPSYIILKPSLLGGFHKTMEWINIAEKLNIHWWATSALESNVGLNAISQWVFTLDNPMVQGLGTGQVFRNNIQSPLQLKGPELFHDPEAKWGWTDLFGSSLSTH